MLLLANLTHQCICWFYLGSLFKTEYRYLSVGVILTSGAIDSFPRVKGHNDLMTLFSYVLMLILQCVLLCIAHLQTYVPCYLSLGLRLAVNMITGHILAKVCVGFIWVAYLKPAITPSTLVGCVLFDGYFHT